MAHGRPVAPVVLSDTVRLEREAMTRSRWLSHALVRRARIILLAADGWSNTAIAAPVELSGATVGMWRKRFPAQGLVGLDDEPRPGGPRSIDDDRWPTRQGGLVNAFCFLDSVRSCVPEREDV